MSQITLPDPAVEQVRSFNRFYTQYIGVLDPYLGSELSLTQVRLLYELAQHPAGSEALTAKLLCERLGLDAGYVSRELRKFEAQGWLRKKASTQDARIQNLSLTAAGKKAFAPLQRRSQEQAASMLAQLTDSQRKRLLGAMQELQSSLVADTVSQKPALQTVVLRDPQPGDMGWVTEQHGKLYAQEYGWNWEFEALVAGICADFVKRFQPQWERCWMAEKDGARVGSVFVVKVDDETAKLRMLILTPEARGLGLGARLTDEAINFARVKGYKKMVLWTNSCLLAARAIYEKRGFKLMNSEAYSGFGQELVSETWELVL
jgi:DNA-binding MarR family transcriptional regulator/GNAT superfamily N-acetyltransferase